MKRRFYFLSILILFLINISSTNALQINFEDLEVQGYNNNGTSLTTPNVFNCELGTCGMEITTIANSYGGAWGIQSPTPLVQGHQYAITLRIRSSNGTIALSSKPNIALGSQMNYAKSNYENSTFNCQTNYSKYIGNYTLQYIIYSQNTLNYLIIPFTTSSSTTANFFIDNIIIDDLGITPLTENQINNVLNNQTTIIQNDINSVNDNINQVEENINSSINNSLNDCVNLFDYNNNIVRGSFIMSDGTIGSDSGLFYQNSYISVQPNTNYTISSNYSQLYRIAEYNNGKVFLNRLINTNSRTSYTFTTSSNTYFIRVSAQSEGISTIQVEKGSSATTFTPFGECKSKIDSTNEKLDNLNDSINDTDSSGASDEAENFFSNFNTDTFGLTSVITAPLELIKSITSKTCTPLQGTLPFVNTEFNLPCLSTIYETYFGSFLNIYRTITFGFVSYWVCIKIFNLVKDFKNPEHDEIEVLDL